MGEKKRYAIILFSFLVFFAIHFSSLALEPQAKTVLGITALALILWLTEAIPLHVTAVLIAFLLVVFGNFPAEKVFAQYFDKVVVLVLGGFVLALGLSKHKLDEFLAYKILGRVGNSPSMVLLGLIAAIAFLSMWMSNSSAAAIGMPIAIVILTQNKLKPLQSNFGKAMVIGVAYAATIGGIGTIIGSTPNVLSQKFLTEKGIQFGFVEWGIRGFPFMIALIVLCWLVLRFVFKPEIKTLEMKRHLHPFTSEQKKVAAIFLLTALLWITESVHGIHNSIVALVPIVLLYVFRLLEPRDFQKAGWDSLIMIGGGIALGMGIESSGLSQLLSAFFSSVFASQPYIIVLLLMGFFGILLTSFLSNTAASAVLIPIVTAISVSLGLDMTNLVVAGAIGVSMDFLFPMGTPPSALAYSTGFIHTRDLLKAGIVLSILGAVLLALFGFFAWG